ncbi:NAD(P)/FAD-dependent oxidoreductase [Aquamicrobium segne]|uniref:NAD(P)/FAD-dependent oxidoreductase n=1 Tax=Aquamicrobium segne TaxID=469547 RepID=A0ABW0H2D2_9HYPH
MVDVTIIGGGIIGVMTAWELARRGRKVLICEKGRVAAEQSSRNWGWIRQQDRDYAELPIMMESLQIWNGLNSKLREEIGFRQRGITYLARNAEKLRAYETWLDGARAYGVDTRMLSMRETQAMLPNAAGGWVGAMTTPSDAMAEPFLAVPALARAASQDGVMIRENCAARALEITNGRLQGVITEKGHVKCDRVVVAAGAWSSLFLKPHNIQLPQLSVLSSVMQTEPVAEFFNAAAGDGRFAFRHRADGGYTLSPWEEHDFFIGPDAFRNFFAYLPTLRQEFSSTHFRLAAPQNYPDAWQTPRRWHADEKTPFENCRILNPKPSRKTLERVLALFSKAFPKIGRPKIQNSWGGMIDTMPDILPVVDHAHISGLTIATGMSGHGFGIGPGMGKVTADLVEEQKPAHALEAFALKRFKNPK